MKRFFFINRNDLEKQPIGFCNATNIQEAINTFATLKVLTTSAFMNIFEVVQVK